MQHAKAAMAEMAAGAEVILPQVSVPAVLLVEMVGPVVFLPKIMEKGWLSLTALPI